MYEPQHLITLEAIRDAHPCAEGWATLLKGLGEARNPNLSRQVTIGDVAAINGLGDALWCLRVLPDRVAIVRATFGAVTRSLRFTEDARVHDCVKAIGAWLAGDTTIDLSAAESAAWSAAWSAESAAWSAAWSAWSAESAAWSAAWSAWSAESAAWSAERDLQVVDLKLTFGLTIKLTVTAE